MKFYFSRVVLFNVAMEQRYTYLFALKMIYKTFYIAKCVFNHSRLLLNYLVQETENQMVFFLSHSFHIHIYINNTYIFFRPVPQVG